MGANGSFQAHSGGVVVTVPAAYTQSTGTCNALNRKTNSRTHNSQTENTYHILYFFVLLFLASVCSLYPSNIDELHWMLPWINIHWLLIDAFILSTLSLSFPFRWFSKIYDSTETTNMVMVIVSMALNVSPVPNADVTKVDSLIHFIHLLVNLLWFVLLCNSLLPQMISSLFLLQKFWFSWFSEAFDFFLIRIRLLFRYANVLAPSCAHHTW